MRLEPDICINITFYTNEEYDVFSSPPSPPPLCNSFFTIHGNVQLHIEVFYINTYVYLRSKASAPCPLMKRFLFETIRANHPPLSVAKKDSTRSSDSFGLLIL